LPLVAGSFTAASLFAMPIIRHYSGFHSRTARQEQVLCQKCRERDGWGCARFEEHCAPCGSGLAREEAGTFNIDADGADAFAGKPAPTES